MNIKENEIFYSNIPNEDIIPENEKIKTFPWCAFLEIKSVKSDKITIESKKIAENSEVGWFIYIKKLGIKEDKFIKCKIDLISTNNLVQLTMI